MARIDIPPDRKIAITIEEAAALASVSDEVVRTWAKDYDFPSTIIGQRGGKRLISRKLFEEWFDKRCQLRIGEKVY